MWILWLILGIIGVLIAVFLLLPFHMIIKNDENDNLLIHFRFFGFTFGEIPEPDTALLKLIKDSIGITRVQENLTQEKLSEDTVQSLREVGTILGGLFSELAAVWHRCTAKVFRIRVVCAEENAADTAIAYGQSCAIVHGFCAMASNLMKIRKRGVDLDVRCNFQDQHKEMRYEFEIMIRVHLLLKALVKLTIKEARRMEAEGTQK